MTSDMPRTEAAFSKVIAWAEAHPDASWEESAQNVLTTLSQELADMERELANCKRDLAIMVGRADNEERATERAERAETKLAALQAKPDVAGLVNSIRALRSARHEWENAPSSELLTLDAAIDALLSLHSENAKLRKHAEAMADAKHVYDWETHAAAYRADFQKEPDNGK